MHSKRSQTAQTRGNTRNSAQSVWGQKEPGSPHSWRLRDTGARSGDPDPEGEARSITVQQAFPPASARG